MIGLAAACVAICLVCGGFIAGMSMRESASAGKGDETKTVQQGGSVVIGSGVSENDQNVGVSTKTYTDIEDIPEDLREQIHFLDSDEFELEKVKVQRKDDNLKAMAIYFTESGDEIEIGQCDINSDRMTVISEADKEWTYKHTQIFEKNGREGSWYWFEKEKRVYYIRLTGYKKIEAIIDGLMN